jgi:hypothetical protein
VAAEQPRNINHAILGVVRRLLKPNPITCVPGSTALAITAELNLFPRFAVKIPSAGHFTTRLYYQRTLGQE